MRTLLSIFCIAFFALHLPAQNVSLNLRLDAYKRFKLSSKFRTELRQQMQFKPTFKSEKQKRERDIFNEIELFPFGKEYKSSLNGSKPATGNNPSPDPDNPFNELNDAPTKVEIDWRSASAVDFDYRLSKTFALGQTYTFFADKNRTRHLFRTDIAFSPKLNNKKLDIPQKLAFQLASQERNGAVIFEHDLSFRSGLEWDFNKKHQLYSTAGINGAFDNGAWKWDRLRADAGLRYMFTKVQSFDFGYRYQRRLDRKNSFSHSISFRYSLRFF